MDVIRIMSATLRNLLHSWQLPGWPGCGVQARFWPRLVKIKSHHNVILLKIS